MILLVSLTACGGGGSEPAASQAPIAAPPVSIVSPPATGTPTQETHVVTPAQETPQSPPAQEPTPTPTPPAKNPGPAPVPPVQEPEPTPVVVIEYYGDSIIWGWDGARQEGSDGWPRVAKTAPQVFAEELGFVYVDRSSPPSGKSAVVNMGHPSRLTEDALAGTWPFESWAFMMSKSPATHIIIEYHSHDSQNADRLRQIIQIAKAYGKKVIIETIGPGVHSGNLTYDQISAGQREAARLEGVPVIDQTTYLSQWNLNTICPDGLHPNQSTYTLKGKYAAAIWSQIKWLK